MSVRITISLLALLLITVPVNVLKAEVNPDTYGMDVLGDELLYIPVIIHIVYSSDDENLSSEQINSQIVALNEDFQARNSDLENIDGAFLGLEAAVNIEFFLADTLLNSSTKGVNRIFTGQSVFTAESLFSSETGGADPIHQDQFLNIWVADLADGLLGFNDQVGIAVDYRSFGTTGQATTPYHMGRTLTHELGHFFSLDHLWGSGGCESDDGISDTPNQEASVSSCEQNISSCGSQDMSQNFMNLSADECLIFFTSGQKSRVREFLLEEKPDLLRPASEVPLAINSSGRIMIAPNPSTGLIQLVHLDEPNVSIRVTSLAGKLVAERIATDNVLDLSDVGQGLFLLHIHTSTRREIVKIVLE